jgi:hypothetical protein
MATLVKMNASATTGENAVTNRGLTFPVLVALGLLFVAAAGCSQRRVACAPRPDDFSVKIQIVAGSKTGTGDCDQRFDGGDSVQVMGMFPYFHAPGSSERINALAIRPSETGDYALNAPDAEKPTVDKNPQHNPFAFGTFTTESPDSQDICHVSTLDPAEIDYDMFNLPPPMDPDAGASDDGGSGDDGGTDAGSSPSDGGRDGLADTAVHALDAGDASTEAGGPSDAGATTEAGGSSEAGTDVGMCTPPDQPTPQTVFPAKHVKYEFKNMQVYVTVALTGSIMASDLTYTQVTPAGSCTAKFTMRGLSPSVPCADECGKPSNSICDHDPGIPTDIHTRCDPESMLCILNDGTRKDIPADTHIPQ